MKLLAKTSAAYGLITFLMFLISGIVCYSLISRLLNAEINESLEIEKNLIIEFIQLHGSLPETVSWSDKKVVFLAANEPTQFSHDTFLESPLKDEYLPYRYVGFPVFASGQMYQAILQTPLIEKDDLLETIGLSLLIFMVCLLISLLFLNGWFSKRIWRPFYQILSQLRGMDFTSDQPVQVSPTTTDEFQQLSVEITKMTNRLHTQYQHAKKFSENASHELKTPITIIRNKLELLIQSGTFAHDQILLINDAYTASSRILKLTGSLLILSKIENRLYTQTENISIRSLIENFIISLHDVWESRHFQIVFLPGEDIIINVNRYLGEILISNILGNAIKHGHDHTVVEIKLHKHLLWIQNRGDILSLNPDQLFNRFVKASGTSESPGLGLSIVREICIMYGFEISYVHEEGRHTITIIF